MKLTNKRRRYLVGILLGMAMLLFSGMFAAAETVNVQWDTTADFDTAFKKALETGRYLEPNDNILYSIKVPAGTYYTDKCFVLYSNTYLDLTGVTIVRTGTPALLRFGHEADVVGIKGYNGFHNITIVGGTLDGNGANNTSTKASLVRFAHAQNITIKGMTLKNVRDGHHMEFAACANVVIDNCTFSGYYGKTTTNNEALQIETLHPKHFSSYGEYDYTSCNNVAVTNCKFTNVQRGVGTHAGMANVYMNKIRIEKNTFENIPGYAIIATNYKNSSIKNNKLKNVGAGIMFRNMAETYYSSNNSAAVKKINNKSVISGNTIEITDRKFKNVVYGIQLYGEQIKSGDKRGIPTGNYRVQGVTVDKNTITLKNKAYGIWCNGASGNKITNNKVNFQVPKKVSGKSGGSALRGVNGTKNTLTGNKMTNTSKHAEKNQFRGISWDAASPKVFTIGKGNTFKGFKITYKK